MPSVLKATNDIAKRGKGKGKGKATEDDVPATGKRVNEVEKKRKDKTLLITSRGVTQRMRHLMLDLEALLPHTKKGECGAASRRRASLSRARTKTKTCACTPPHHAGRGVEGGTWTWSETTWSKSGYRSRFYSNDRRLL
jgi:hypothetical protein